MGYDLSYPLQLLAKLLIPLNLLGKATDYTNVFYKNNDGLKLHAYLALPPHFDASTSYPAAVVLHAWNGMGLEPLYFADLLAEQGYIVLAPDLFRNVRTAETNLPWNIATVLLTPQERMNADIDTALDYLTQTQNVDSTRIFSGPGFCFGGSQSVNLGIRRPMAGTISLYGADVSMLQDGNKNKLWGNLGAGGSPVLGIFGRDDMNPNVAAATGFEQAMTFRGITNTVTIYDGVGHAFVNPVDHSSGKTQAVAAWDQVVNFMNAQAFPHRHRALDINDVPAAPTYHNNGISFSWLWGHVMDMFRGTGHFSHRHGLRHGDVHNHPTEGMGTAKNQIEPSVSSDAQFQHTHDSSNATMEVGRAA